MPRRWPRSDAPATMNPMPSRRANPILPADRAWPARGLTIGTAAPVGLTAYPGGTADRAAAGAPGNETLGAPADATFPRTAETTGVPNADGNADAGAPPTEFGVFPTGTE